MHTMLMLSMILALLVFLLDYLSMRQLAKRVLQQKAMLEA